MAHDKENRRDQRLSAPASAERPGAPGPVRGGAEAAAGDRVHRVLVAEDNPHVVGMYQYALRKLAADGVPLTVEYAANGHDALVRLTAPPGIDLLLSDLYMPVLDGFTLIERMKKDASLAKVPVLVISAGAADARARALELGVDVYLQKPVQLADVVTTVRTLLRVGG
jgi:CheY-like chemotaxis protein